MPNPALSEARGPADFPLIDKTIAEIFDEAAARWGERDAVIARHQAARLSYRQLRERVDAAARGLIALGLSPGERLAIWSPNCAEWTILQYAAAKAGLILVGLNPAYRAAELEYALTKVGCAALACATGATRMNLIATLREVAPEIGSDHGGSLQARRLPSLRLLIGLGEPCPPGFLSLDALMAKDAADSAFPRPARIADPAVIQFTSGTTGPPKAATLSHRNVVNAAFLGAERLGIASEDRICVPVPLFHSFGMIGGNLLAATHGAAAIYPSAGFDPGTTLAAIAAERCTALYGVPAMFGATLAHPDFATADLRSLRTGIIAGAPCPEALMRRAIEAMHLPELITAFGMSETSAAGLATARSDPLARRLATVGRVTGHTEIKIVDEAGAVVPRGVAGELCTRGFAVMLGYWNDADATATAIDAEGWMHTGDLVALDEEGYGRVFGRLGDLVNRGGEKILPGEIEAVLVRHPAVEAAQVFGIPDPKRGEEVCAWIKLKPGERLTEAQVRSFCSGEVANYKIPRHIRFVDAFPMTATGKIQKFAMREQMKATR
jgi:fatty-acyl-CoA synthase